MLRFGFADVNGYLALWGVRGCRQSLRLLAVLTNTATLLAHDFARPMVSPIDFDAHTHEAATTVSRAYSNYV